MLNFIAFMPHPPIAVPEVGGEEAKKVAATIDSMRNLSQEIRMVNPELLVAITPHGHVLSDAVTVTDLDFFEGDLAQFGTTGIKVGFSADKAAVEAVIAACRHYSFPCAPLDKGMLGQYRRASKLDHGLVVPLSFIAKAGWQGKLLPVNVGLLSYEELYHFGVILRESLDALGRKWVLLASGDMSHCLLPQAPAGYSPQGAIFDEIIRQAVAEGDVRRILSLEPDLVEEAAECGLRPLIMALGAMDGYEIETSVLSYEGPFGVGYLVARLQAGKKSATRELCEALYKERKEKLEKNRAKESWPVRLARRSITHYLQEGKYLKDEGNYGEGDKSRAGVFVSLKKHGSLRGCIGTIEPTQENLAQEIIYNAVSAAFRDPRFTPLEEDELDELEISVDVLAKPETVSDINELDPDEYGVIVSKGPRRGLLLPKLSGINSAEQQVTIAKQKAGIRPEEQVKLERFRVVRYT